mgnify:CR=1 FL=1
MNYQDYRNLIKLPVDPQQVMVDGFAERLARFAERFVELYIEALYNGNRCISLREEFDILLPMKECYKIFFMHYSKYIDSRQQEITMSFEYNAIKVEARTKPVKVEEEHFTFHWNPDA